MEDMTVEEIQRQRDIAEAIRLKIRDSNDRDLSTICTQLDDAERELIEELRDLADAEITNDRDDLIDDLVSVWESEFSNTSRFEKMSLDELMNEFVFFL